AVGKTPDARPALSKPFAGFIWSSLDLFNALKKAGARISPLGFVGGVSEVYPGHIWTILGNRHVLPRKSTPAGRAVRKRILEVLGVVGLPGLLTHDQNDACVAALIAAAADGKVPGVSVASIGSALLVDMDGTLREGPMVIPQFTTATADAISVALGNTPLLEAPSPAVAHSASGPSDTTGDDLLSLL